MKGISMRSRWHMLRVLLNLYWVWRHVPMLRFGQLIGNVCTYDGVSDEANFRIMLLEPDNALVARAHYKVRQTPLKKR